MSGASGYIGSHICLALVRRGYDVRACVRDPGDAVKTTCANLGTERAPLLSVPPACPCNARGSSARWLARQLLATNLPAACLLHSTPSAQKPSVSTVNACAATSG